MRDKGTVMCIIAVVMFICAPLSAAAHADDADLPRLVASIRLDNVEGRIDHMAYDAARDRLYVAAIDNRTLEVVDLKAGKRIRTVAKLARPAGVAVIPDGPLAGAVVVATGGDGKAQIFDAELKKLGEIDSLDDADNVRYDAAAGLAYVGYGDGALAAIDPVKLTKVGDVRLNAHPESFQLTTATKRIYVNVPNADYVAVIDREKHAFVGKFIVKGAQANFPMALDEANKRVFIGCRSPAKVLVMDMDSGTIVASFDCCRDADDLFYDVTRKRLYVTGGEGFLDVFEPNDANHYTRVGHIPTAWGARTSLFVPATRKLFVAVPFRGQQQRCELRVFDVK